MDTKWIVQIYAYDKNGTPYIGTGYAIDDRHILTASHVLYIDNLADEPAFKLVWAKRNFDDTLVMENKKPVYDLSSISNTMSFTKDAIKFNSKKDELDLAVIECPKLPPFKAPKVILADDLFKNAIWETQGFPRIVRTEQRRNLFGFTLQYESQTESFLTGSIQLKPDEKQFAENEKIWGGLSGAPIFANNRLIAVITNTGEKTTNTFSAASIPWVKEHRKDFCEAIKPSLNQEHITQQNKELHNIIKPHIKKLLEKNFNTDILIDNLDLTDDIKNMDDIVDYLLNQSVLDSISALTILIENHLPKRIEDIEEVTGWLLLKSVDPTWWFNNKDKFEYITGEFDIREPDYIEVIISRSFLRPAKYMLDYQKDDKSKSGKAKPESWWDKRDLSLMIYDASDTAIDFELLKPIYKDLFSVDIPHNNISSLLDDIKTRASAKCRNRKGKMIYYLVTKDYLDILETKSWFLEHQKNLTNCLRFICCGKKEQLESSCVDGEKDVLAQLAEFLMTLKNIVPA